MHYNAIYMHDFFQEKTLSFSLPIYLRWMISIFCTLSVYFQYESDSRDSIFYAENWRKHALFFSKIKTCDFRLMLVLKNVFDWISHLSCWAPRDARRHSSFLASFAGNKPTNERNPGKYFSCGFDR